jgi:uncharacterized protein (UPF0212 family)
MSGVKCPHCGEQTYSIYFKQGPAGHQEQTYIAGFKWCPQEGKIFKIAFVEPEESGLGAKTR